MFLRVGLGLTLAGWCLAVPGAAHAQIPGDELPSSARVRSDFLNATYADVKQVLADWQDHHRRNEPAKLGRLFTEDGLFSPVEGWYVQGRRELIDTMTVRIPTVQNYHASLIDFTASGGLAYYLGRMSYHRTEGAGKEVSGTFVMVLYLDGRRWKIRSYVERLAVE